jgi:hypothetical protein
MVTEFESPNSRIRRTRIHISERTPTPHLTLQQKIRRPVPRTRPDPLWIIRKVNGPVLHPLKPCGRTIPVREHAILPARPGPVAQTPRRSLRLELVPVVSVLHEEVHVAADVDMHDYGCVVLEVVVHGLEVGEFIAQFDYAAQEEGFGGVVLFLAVVVHEDDGCLL